MMQNPLPVLESPSVCPAKATRSELELMTSHKVTRHQGVDRLTGLLVSMGACFD